MSPTDLWQGAQCGLDGTVHGVKLVISSDNLDNACARVAKHREIPNQLQEAMPFKHTLNDGREFRQVFRCDTGTVHGSPGHETFQIGRQTAKTRLQSVRGHECCVGAEQGRNLLLVGLKLVECPFERSVLVTRVLEFDHGER